MVQEIEETGERMDGGRDGGRGRNVREKRRCGGMKLRVVGAASISALYFFTLSLSLFSMLQGPF